MEHEGGGRYGGVDPCFFCPCLYIIMYFDTQWSGALRCAVTQTRNEVGNMSLTWSAHKEVTITYGWHLEQGCPAPHPPPFPTIWGWYKGPQPWLWVGLWAACINKITISVIPNYLNNRAVLPHTYNLQMWATGLVLDTPDIEGAGWEVYSHRLIKVVCSVVNAGISATIFLDLSLQSYSKWIQ
jgi:hypothetical protein